MSDNVSDNSTIPAAISHQNSYSHFESLHSKHSLSSEQQHLVNTLQSMEPTIDQHNYLDEPSTNNEILKAVLK